jgi:glycine betaine/proline transport system substrate-binding protein
MRAVWDTFWYGGVMLQTGLQRLGYKVADAQSLAPATLYKALAQGDGHFTADVVMPNAQRLLETVKTDVQLLGPIMKPGSVTGYLIDRATAEKHNIRYITDLRDPEKAKLFAGSDGRARLLGPGVGWNDEAVAIDHMSRLGLKNTVSLEQGEYNVLVGDAVSRLRAGQPVLLYAWYPNTATVQMLPGKDLVWLQMREADTKPEFAFSGIPGCAGGGESCNTGWSPTTYYIAVNTAWAKENPAAVKFLSLVRMDLKDRVEQNMRMVKGEKREADFVRHANEWISRNQRAFDGWIQEAMAAKS